MAKASLFKVAQRVLEFVNDPLTKQAGRVAFLLDGRPTTDRRRELGRPWTPSGGGQSICKDYNRMPCTRLR